MFKQVNNDLDYQHVRAIRETVFVKEQGVSPSEEYDEHELTAQYVIGYDTSGDPIATARYRGIGDTAKIERVAVLKNNRGQGIGKKLIQYIEKIASEQGYQHFKLGAQTHAIPFYEALGYVAYGDVFMDANIPHRYMKKTIN